MKNNEFRTNKSLASDIKKLQESLSLNQQELINKFVVLKEDQSYLNNYKTVKNAPELVNNIQSKTSKLRDIIEILENDVISLNGLELFETKTSPDSIIELLRNLKQNSRIIDSKTVTTVKLIIKSKGNGLLADEIESSNNELLNEINTVEKRVNLIRESLDKTLDELNLFEKSSKELLKSRIL